MPVCRKPFRNERVHFYTLLLGVSCVLGRFIPGRQRKDCLTENVSSLCSVKGATLPCDACASIPCGLAVREQQVKIQRQGFARSYRIRDAVRLVVHDDGRTIGGNQQEPALHANSAT